MNMKVSCGVPARHHHISRLEVPVTPVLVRVLQGLQAITASEEGGELACHSLNSHVLRTHVLRVQLCRNGS